MKYQYHVFTPLSRPQNFRLLADMLRPSGVIWHVVHESQHVPRIHPDDTLWIRPVMCPDPDPGWFPGHWKFNWLLNQHRWELEHRYILLSDDDFFEPGFFEKMDAVDGDVLICSMKRGDRSPPKPDTPTQPTTMLHASPGSMGCGGVGGQQIMMHGWCYRRYRLGPGFCGDWEMIYGVLQSYVPIFVPDAFVWFNYLEPGRWDGAPVPS